MRDSGEDGYATPAAAVICMAIAVVAAAVTARGLSELRIAKAELARTQAEYVLAGAHDSAVAAISTSAGPPPYRWNLLAVGETLQVTAEPERGKLSALAAAVLSDAILTAFGVADAEHAALRRRLESLPASRSLAWIADQAEARTWRECGPAFVSPYGVGRDLVVPVYAEPMPIQTAGSWRAGEVWRVVIQHPAGWREERIIRFTGNGLAPAAVIGRRLSRSSKGQPKCEALFQNPPAA